ncbi:MAG: WbqC family protein [Rikenellaceae bacterium]
MNILPLTYLGNIEYFSLLCREDCIIDTHENYVKQTYRNRCDIMSANGVMSLTLNLKKPTLGAKCAVRDMRIDYSKNWQHQHWLSIVSAYRSSAYFEHFEHIFHPFYHSKYEFLLDYNLELIEIICKLLGYDNRIKLSENYITSTDTDKDLRAHFTPKNNSYKCPEYYQVFGERIAFSPNLSIIDLLFCENSLL